MQFSVLALQIRYFQTHENFKSQKEGAKRKTVQNIVGIAVIGIAVDEIAVVGIAVHGIAVDGIAVDGVAVDGIAVDGIAVDGIAVVQMLCEAQRLPMLKCLFAARDAALKIIVIKSATVCRQNENQFWGKCGRQDM